MKIKRLVVPEYKNVTVDVELQAGLITLLVGQNGMGKSNLLEVLLLIFDELNQLAKGRRLTERERLPFDYVLDYECGGRVYRAKKEGDEHFFYEILTDRDGVMIERNAVIQEQALPSQIIGYYSGENKRIRELVAKHIKREESSKRRRYSKGNIAELQPNKLFFAENRHSMIVLATLLLYQEHPAYAANIKKVLREIVHVDCWDRICLRFRNPGFAKMGDLRKQGKTLDDYIDRLTQGEYLEETSIFWGIRGNVDTLLRLLLYSALDDYMKFSILSAKRGNGELFDIESIPKRGGFIELLFERFPTPMDFLNTLEECYVLNMVEKFEIYLRKEGDKAYYPYLHLSEGEQQYLTVMGLIALSHSSQDETLFLLDEPDTHINPQWQRNYIRQVKELSDAEADRQGKAFFISTHSPLLVQANSSDDADVDLLLFKKNEGGKIEIDAKEDDMLRNWRIDQVLMSKYFDLPSSRPTSLDEFMERRNSVVEGQSEHRLHNSLEGNTDEFGYLPTGETLADVEAMALIHRIADRARREGHL